MSFTLILISNDQTFRTLLEDNIKAFSDDYQFLTYAEIQEKFILQKAIYLLDRPGKDVFLKIMSTVKAPYDTFSTFYVRDSYDHQTAMFYMQNGAYDFVCSTNAIDQLAFKLRILKNKLTFMMESQSDSGLQLLSDFCILKFKGKTIKFSKSEYHTLHYLFSKCGTTTLTSDILLNTTEPDTSAGNLHVRIFKIKEKMKIIKNIKIQRVSKVGYKLTIAA